MPWEVSRNALGLALRFHALDAATKVSGNDLHAILIRVAGKPVCFSVRYCRKPALRHR
jgi:hypothetical protein